MTRADDRDKSKPSGGRAERLAAALRENLRRRKAQERRRSAQEAPQSAAPPARDEKGR